MKNAQKLFEENGYSVADNRNFNWKNINKAMQFVEITVARSGFVKQRTINGFKYRLALSFKKESGAYYTTYYTADTLRDFKDSPETIGSFVIKKIINFRKELFEKKLLDNSSEIQQTKGLCKCDKCSGKGIIPSFHFYCEGICFDCLGLGYR